MLIMNTRCINSYTEHVYATSCCCLIMTIMFLGKQKIFKLLRGYSSSTRLLEYVCIETHITTKKRAHCAQKKRDHIVLPY